MKRHFKTVVDRSAADHERFYVSAGKVGLQVEINYSDLSKVLDYALADIVR